MSSVDLGTFGLHADVPDAALDPAWCALVCQQAPTLTGMLHRIQMAVARVQWRPEVYILAANADGLLAAQAQQHVNLERELGQLRALVTDLSPAPTELTQRVQRLERVLAVLHANLAAARQQLATLLEKKA